MSPTIGVVVPHYDDERRLRWVLNALAEQSFPAQRLHVVVADDGSSRPPALPDLPYRCDLVRQQDRGFRAAAARNRGAAAVVGDLLVFLDGDTIPAPGYLAAMGAESEQVGSGFVGVGTRQHADFDGCTDEQVAAWVRTCPPTQRLLEAPAWLAEGYARTAELKDADEEDFRLVISAVLAVDRGLFERTGGFDETITGYGGEDWDLAWRCWLLGARLRHVAGAIAWHDGPDAVARTGDRSASRAAKDAEALALAARITLPSVRGAGLIWEQPDIAVRIHGQYSDAQLFATVLALLRGSDAAVWCSGRDALPAVFVADPRVHAGAPPDRTVDRSRYQVDVCAPLQLSSTLAQACAVGEVDVPGVLRIRGTRRLALGLPAPLPAPTPEWLRELPDRSVEQILGKAARDE